MDLHSRSVALYGRFSAGARERLQRDIVQRGGTVARDLTRRTDYFVVGGHANALIDSGSLVQRLRNARERSVPVMGERRFAAALAGQWTEDARLPLATALGTTALTDGDALVLAAFDLIALDEGRCRFADAGIIRTAAELMSRRRTLSDVVRILAKKRDSAPSGRHRIVLAPTGEAALQWDDGLTTLDGQGYLPLDSPDARIDVLFEAAELSEAHGEHDEAARLYEICTQADRADPIAPFNLGNIRLVQDRYDEAATAYQRALARDAEFVEARYNLALALEASGRIPQACEELKRALQLDRTYSDAMFNLAQLLVKTGEVAEAKRLYERYLDFNPPSEWAATARKAIIYCTACLEGHQSHLKGGQAPS